MRIVQINLQHSKVASANLGSLLTRGGPETDVVLIQEPWIGGNNKVQGLNIQGYSLCCKKESGKIRSCILIKKHINFFFLDSFSDVDCTSILIEEDCKKPLCICSAYLPGDENGDVPSETVEKVASNKKWDLIIGCDANAHHSLWGSSDINERGESIFDFIFRNNLYVCNIGKKPTFRNSRRSEVLDITLKSNNIGIQVSNWLVSEEESLSDHSWIIFDINRSTPSQKPYRDPKKTNWDLYGTEVKTRLGVQSQVKTAVELDSKVNILTEILSEAFEKACKMPRKRQKKQPLWWTTDIGKAMKVARKLKNQAKREQDIRKKREIVEVFKQKYQAVKYLIRTAKRDSWRKYCESLTEQSETSRIRKLLSKDPIPLGMITKGDGTWTESSGEAIELLLQTHFPGCLDVGTSIDGYTMNSDPTTNLSDIVTQDRIIWAMGSFEPYKSPGPDGIYPKLIQEVLTELIPWLMDIYISSLKLGYIPVAWRKVKVVFIPKAGKISHTTPKDYRPISLSSFLLKGLERLLDAYIRENLPKELISNDQHAYLKGKSTETALHEVVSCIEKGLADKEYTLATFLDIEGAFNNVTTDAIQHGMESVGINPTVVKWTVNMLTTRLVSSELGNSTVTKVVTRGTPQGGVISPLLWLLVVNTILKQLKNRGVKLVAYADDVVVLARGKFLNTLSELMQGALGKLLTWAEKWGLGINPSKTEMVLFTRKHKLPTFVKPKLKGEELKLSDQAKYLGVILDRKLNWNQHIEERRKKAYAAQYICRRFSGSTWGLIPKISHWLYISVVRPILTYGCIVWWPALLRTTARKRLTAVQRSACLGTSGALRSTPTEALECMLNLTPIDLHVKELAAKSAVRLLASKQFKELTYGHSKILKSGWGQLDLKETDYIIPNLLFSRQFELYIPNRDDWEADCVIRSGETNVYTDGSKMECGTGAGIYSNFLSINESVKLRDSCTVFQAEVAGILTAVRRIKETGAMGKNFTIYTDSQAAVKSLGNVTIKI